MSVDSNALEEYDYYEDIEPLKWFNFKIIRFILMFKIITFLLLNLILTKKDSPFDYSFEIKTKICERTLCED
jgi:hypothetical protein